MIRAARALVSVCAGCACARYAAHMSWLTKVMPPLLRKRPMYILGINSGWHDSSAALLKDGELVVMIEQDRVSRMKHAMGETPTEAIAVCLREAGITLDEVAAVAVGWDEPVCSELNGERFDLAAFEQWILPNERLPRETTPPIQFVPHHVAHAASGLWTSGLSHPAILVMDGRGETQSTSLAAGSHGGIELLAEWDISQSLGNYYGYAAEWAGFSFWSGPGKLMGLAPYGRPQESTFLTPTPTGYHFAGSPPPPPDVSGQEQQHRALLDQYFQSLYPYAKGDPADVMAYAGFAATIQTALEEAIFSLARLAGERTEADGLVIAGGVGLNCTLNGRLARSGLFSDVYVPPVTYDTGVSLGAALFADRERCPERNPQPRMEHAYWGVHPTEVEIETAVRESGLPATRLSEDELVAQVANHLTQGRIVGWFQGRAEVGQRALGARSMLCDPRERRHLVRVNLVKGREVWRPLAPSVMEEYAGDLFAGGLPNLANFMLAAMPVRPDAHRSVPATVHVDGSARPQIVRRATNPRYWRLIDAFRQRTGVPAIMNTSFNLADEPIVHSPGDAIASFCRSELDVLAIEDYLIEKPSLAEA
jgi:carbamoyltransferase